MIDFIGIFAILFDNKIQFVSYELSGERYPEPDDSVSLCAFMSCIEPYEFIDIAGVVDMFGNVVWEDLENDL